MQPTTRWLGVLRQTQPSGLRFGYRSHSDRIRRINKGAFGDWMEDPPVDQPGMTRVALDLQGRLLELVVVPPLLLDSIPAAVVTPDWRRLLDEAGFDAAKLTTAVPRWRPAVHAESPRPGMARIPIRRRPRCGSRQASLRDIWSRFESSTVGSPRSTKNKAKSVWAKISQQANSVFFCSRSSARAWWRAVT